MSRTYRFIGGPLHGQLKACNAPSIEVPVYHGAGWTPEDANLLRPSFTTVTYRTQLATVGGSPVRVMVPTHMSQEEFIRRLADFIEGTTPSCCGWGGCPCRG